MYQAVEQLVNAAEAVVFLTATPIQLEQDNLFVLLNLLRPDVVIDKNTFKEMAEPNHFINEAVRYVREAKYDWQHNALMDITSSICTSWGMKAIVPNPVLKEIIDVLKKDEISGEERIELILKLESLHTFSNMISRTRRCDIKDFTTRKTITVKSKFTEQQQKLHDLILNLNHEILSYLNDTDNTKFMMTTIRRQMASCLNGMVGSLDNMFIKYYSKLIFLDEQSGKLYFKDKTCQIFKMKMDEIKRFAKSLPREDPKLDDLLWILYRKGLEGKNNKVMIFTEFKHTIQYLYRELTLRGYRVAFIHGDIKDEERRRLRKRFNPEETPVTSMEAIDIMIFSEVGCEGLDYQFCDCLINYDIPWNPMRIEQRIGRIDRNGQKSELVSIYNMIVPGTIDADIYERCTSRIEEFYKNIGDSEEILGNITDELIDIVLNLTLTESEREEKLEQIAANKIRAFKEREELEASQNEFFGIQVPSSEYDLELNKAVNYWLSAENIQKLVMAYLKDILNEDKEYIRGKGNIKQLRLSKEAKLVLLKEYDKSNFKKNEMNRNFRKWLDKGEQYLPIIFEYKVKKPNSTTLMNVRHPLVKMAAEYFKNKGNTVSTLRVETNKVHSGIYPFIVYQWKLTGIKEDLQLKIVSENNEINTVLLDLIKKSQDNKVKVRVNSNTWKMVDKIHYGLWKSALKEHKDKIEEVVLYRESSLKTSHNARITSIKEQLNNSTNNRHKRLIEGKLRSAENDFSMRMEELNEARKKADIHFEILSYGALIVTSKGEM